MKTHSRRFLIPAAVVFFTLLFGCWQLQTSRQQQAQRIGATPTAKARAWKPKRFGPPTLKELKMPLAASYNVAGAGEAGYNGDYVDLGATFGGVAAFELDASHFLFKQGTVWYLSATLGDYIDSHYTGGNSSDPLSSSGSWSTQPAGTAPPPTVTESAPAAPGTPGVPTFSAKTDTTATITLPSFPSDTTSLSLQRSASGAGVWSTLVSGQGAGATYSETGRTPGVTYDYRTVAVGAGGSTSGSTASMQMLPAAPGLVTFNTITSTTLNAVLPSLPTGAVSLKLQRSAHGAGTWSDVATGQSGGATVAQTGLTQATTYDYRAVAVNAAGSTNGTLSEVSTVMPTAGSAALKIFWPASVSNPANVAAAGTGAVIANLTQGSATATAIVPGVTTYGSNGGAIPTKKPVLVQHQSHYKAADFTALDALTRQSAVGTLEDAIDKAKGVSVNISGLVDPVWYADQGELGFVSHVDGEARQTEIMLTLGASSTEAAGLISGALSEPSAESAFAHRSEDAAGDYSLEIQHFSSVRGAIPQGPAGNVKTYEFPLAPVLPSTGNAVKIVLTRPAA